MKEENLRKKTNYKLSIVASKLKNKIANLKKGKLNLFKILILIIVVLFSFFSGYIFGNKNNKMKNVVVDKNISKFIENYNYIIDNYYKEVARDSLVDNAIAGMMNSLDDPYSVYLDKDNNMNNTLDGSYSGLGVAVSKADDGHYIKIKAVFENSPAFKAELKEGDIIVKINNSDTYDMPLSQFSGLVLNNKDNEYELHIIRGEEKITKSLNRQSITIDSVSSKVIEEGNKKIGYIYISVFANNTASQFLNKIQELESLKIDGLIIDVRNNTGGYLTAVEKILKHFLTNKQIIYQMQKGSKITKVYGAAKKNKEYDIVLVGNGYSASASEILIAGLKDNLNSIYVGEKSYGKGLVQEVVTLSNGQQYKITTKKWLTPKGSFINDTEGIIPDIEVNNRDINVDSQLNEAIKHIIQGN